jgi:hypothetical protein
VRNVAERSLRTICGQNVPQKNTVNSRKNQRIRASRPAAVSAVASASSRNSRTQQLGVFHRHADRRSTPGRSTVAPVRELRVLVFRRSPRPWRARSDHLFADRRTRSARWLVQTPAHPGRRRQVERRCAPAAGPADRRSASRRDAPHPGLGARSAAAARVRTATRPGRTSRRQRANAASVDERARDACDELLAGSTAPTE